MSAPIDIPQNINLHLAHAERVVQTPKPETQDNSSYQFSFELQNKTPGNQQREVSEKKRRKQEQDSYEGHASSQQEEKPGSQQEEGPPPETPIVSEEPKALAIGRLLDVSA